MQRTIHCTNIAYFHRGYSILSEFSLFGFQYAKNQNTGME